MSRSHTSPARIVPGTVILLLGIGFLLDSFNLLDFGHLVSTWWPLIVIAVGLGGVIGSRGNRTGSWIVLLVGVLLLLGRLDLVDIDVWRLFWPIVLIMVGVSLLTGKRPRYEGAEPTAEQSVDVFAAFSGNDRRATAKAFRGGSMTALFGGTKLDLRDAELEEDAQIQVNVAFGGAELIVPRDCLVTVDVMPFFGGVEDRSERKTDAKQRLHVGGSVAFGGLEIKN